MGVNKLTFGGRELINLTDATVTTDTLEEGVTAYGATGDRITGTGLPGRVRYDVEQSLTEEEQQRVQSNLGIKTFSGSWNDLADKPFGADPITIVWDGNRLNKNIVQFDTSTYYVKVSDEIPSNDMIKTGRLRVFNQDTGGQGGWGNISNLISRITFKDDYVFFSGVFAVVRKANIVVSGRIFTEPGIYFYLMLDGNTLYRYTTDLIIEGNLKTLDEQFIPNTIARASDIPEVSYPVTSVNGMTGDVVVEAGGGAGVHIGTDAPTDESINLWVDTDAEADGGGGAVDIDASLSKSGAAADAKAVGDALARKESAIPKLTKAQKSELFSLMNAYYDNRSFFCYDWGTTRNYYANNRCWKDFYKMVPVTDAEGNPVYNEDGSEKKEKVYSHSLFRLCCATFVELLWMGRKATDFIGRNGASYSNVIDKAFDWGYYFQYKDRANMGGVAKRDENGDILCDSDGNSIGYYKYRRPLGTDEYSYSVNTKYSADLVGNKNHPNAQEFNGFMMANDMAKELYHMGCEIPFEELEQGDLVFIGDKWSESVNEYLFIQNTRFRGISHVAMVYKIVDGVVWLIDCTDDEFNTKAGTGLPILLCRENHSSEMSTRARAIYMLGNVVMCARHPAAWKKSNMATVSSVDFMPMAYQSGRSIGYAIPFTPNDAVVEGLWYVYNSSLGQARYTRIASDWNNDNFIIQYTNAT